MALSSLSRENSKLRDSKLTPTKVMIATALACKLGPHVWPIVQQQIGLLLSAARRQLVAYVRDAAYASVKALVATTTRLIKMLVMRALAATGTDPVATVSAAPLAATPVRDAPAHDMPESLMVVHEVSMPAAPQVQEALLPLPNASDLALRCPDECKLGLFDDGATSHFTKLKLGKIAGTKKAVKSTFATGTNKQGAQPTETNLHAIVYISADGKEEEPRI